VVDPCCGAGALLLAAHERLRELNDVDTPLVGCDVDAAASEAALNYAVHSARRVTIHHGAAPGAFTGEAPRATWVAGGRLGGSGPTVGVQIWAVSDDKPPLARSSGRTDAPPEPFIGQDHSTGSSGLRLKPPHRRHASPITASDH
jgi:hypothetical protein